MATDNLRQQVKSFFNLSSYLEDENIAKQSIIEGVSFKGPNILILIIAIFIASLGLNTNSAAVIIGAMLISPLMGPIIGIGLGVGTYNFPLVKRAARNLGAAALFSVLASTIYFLISPVSEGHSELLARTSPTIYDVLIGFFGGGAGIVAIACKDKGNVIPGVAIATALMPPLCTAGYGIATWQLQYFAGAFYLFLINSIFIAFATLIGVKLFQFTPCTFANDERKRRVKRWLYTIVILTLLPSIFLTFNMLRESYFVNDANDFIEEEFDLPNTQVFTKKVYIQRWHKYMDVTLIGQQVNIDSLQTALTAKMQESPMLRGTSLKITQGFSTSIAATKSDNVSDMRDIFSSAFNQIEAQNARIDSLNRTIAASRALDSFSYDIAPEIKVLFPEISSIAISRTMLCNTNTLQADTLDIVLVELTSPLKDRTKVVEYLETRTGLPHIYLLETRASHRVLTESTQRPSGN